MVYMRTALTSSSNPSEELLRKEFFRVANEYRVEHEKYLAIRTPSDADKLRLKNVTDDLNIIMGLINNRASVGGNNALLAAAQSINEYTRQIYEKSNKLQLQQNELERKKEELHSKQKQVEMGVQKNRYRRNLIVILTILNIIMIGVIYYFYNKSGNSAASGTSSV